MATPITLPLADNAQYGAANLGDTAALQVIVTADVTELGITTGGVEFYEQLGTGATAALIDLGAGTLESPNVFVLRTPPLAAGDNNFIAVYSGDGFYQPSTSAALTVPIAGADDTLSIGGPSCAIAEGTDVSLSLPNDPYGNGISQWTINWDDGAPLNTRLARLRRAGHVHDYRPRAKLGGLLRGHHDGHSQLHRCWLRAERRDGHG